MKFKNFIAIGLLAAPTAVLAGTTMNGAGLSEKASLLEIFYRYKVSDNISITPAIIYVANDQAFKNASSNWGGVIQTKFTF